MESPLVQKFPGRGAGTMKADDAATSLKMAEVKNESKRPASDELPAQSSPSINLGLEIGTNSTGNQNGSTEMVQRRGESVLTFSQLHEFEQQVLIHKHLAAGLRVPTHLLIPISRSVARTLGSNVNGMYERYRSSKGLNPLGFDYKSMMDPEPDRCRRTDGKKWRCSWSTVPSQKYCERHMHRGRQRSRKPVEASEIYSRSHTNLLKNPDRDGGCPVAGPATATSENFKTKNHLSCDFPTAITFPLITETVSPSSKTVTETTTSSTHTTTAILSSGYEANKTITMVPSSAASATSTPVATVPGINPTAITSINTSCVIDLKDVCSCTTNVGKNENAFRRNDTNVQKIPSPGLGFSPNSVLQVPGCSSSCHDSKFNTELEPGRCRRTDGKKWRCRREVIPNQKYCGLHMHRGSKKHLKASPTGVVLATSAATSAINLIPSATAKRARINTNLSMAIRAGDKQRPSEERSNASSSSETTITDTTVSAYENTSF